MVTEPGSAARRWCRIHDAHPFIADFYRVILVLGVPLVGLTLLARAVHDWVWLAVLIVPASWLYMHRWYCRIHGHRLRWWAMWAAHGAVLFGFRLERWEATDGT